MFEPVCFIHAVNSNRNIYRKKENILKSGKLKYQLDRREHSKQNI